MTIINIQPFPSIDLYFRPRLGDECCSMEENKRVRIVIGLICGAISLIIGIAITFVMTFIYDTPWSFKFVLGMVGMVAFMSGFYSIFFALEYAPIERLNSE